MVLYIIKYFLNLISFNAFRYISEYWHFEIVKLLLQAIKVDISDQNNRAIIWTLEVQRISRACIR